MSKIEKDDLHNFKEVYDLKMFEGFKPAIEKIKKLIKTITKNG